MTPRSNTFTSGIDASCGGSVMILRGRCPQFYERADRGPIRT